MTAALPFTWREFEREIGKELPAEAKRRLTAAVRSPGERTWTAARSIVVAPQMSIMGQTLWQCAQAITLTEIPASEAPPRWVIEKALCYAAGLPYPYGRRS